MPTILTHAVAGASLALLLAPAQHRRALLPAAAILAMLPDADVVGFRWGVSYGDLLGHRGLTHSLAFAAVAGLAGSAWFRAGERLKAALVLALATASHGFLDAFTNGGLGVAFFAPLDATRYFFPVTPIEVSPLSAAAFLSQRGISVLASEFVWVWCPALLVSAAALAMRKRSALP